MLFFEICKSLGKKMIFLPSKVKSTEKVRRGLLQVPMSKVGRARNAGRGWNFWWHFCVCWYYTKYNTREWIEGIVKCLFTHTLTFRMA